MVPGWIFLAWLFLVGASVGSFINVVVARLPEGLSVAHPRSRCPACLTPIAWYDNIPILSWVLLRARCRSCKAPVAVRYPLVELLMGSLAVALWVRLGGGWEFALWFPLAGALLAIAFLDIDHWWIPDLITFPAMAIAFAFSFAPGRLGPVASGLGLAPAAALWALGWVFLRLTGREGMGLGDVKLLALLGLVFGPAEALSLLVAASIQGAVVGGLVNLTGGHATPQVPADSDDSRSEGVGGEGDPPPEGSAQDEGEGSVADGARADDAEEDWTPPPGAFPFGPLLVLSAFEVILLPDVFGGWIFRFTRFIALGIAGGGS